MPCTRESLTALLQPLLVALRMERFEDRALPRVFLIAALKLGKEVRNDFRPTFEFSEGALE